MVVAQRANLKSMQSRAYQNFRNAAPQGVSGTQILIGGVMQKMTDSRGSLSDLFTIPKSSCWEIELGPEDQEAVVRIGDTKIKIRSCPAGWSWTLLTDNAVCRGFGVRGTICQIVEILDELFGVVYHKIALTLRANGFIVLRRFDNDGFYGVKDGGSGGSVLFLNDTSKWRVYFVAPSGKDRVPAATDFRWMDAHFDTLEEAFAAASAEMSLSEQKR